MHEMQKIIHMIAFYDCDYKKNF